MADGKMDLKVQITSPEPLPRLFGPATLISGTASATYIEAGRTHTATVTSVRVALEGGPFSEAEWEPAEKVSWSWQSTVLAGHEPADGKLVVVRIRADARYKEHTGFTEVAELFPLALETERPSLRVGPPLRVPGSEDTLKVVIRGSAYDESGIRSVTVGLAGDDPRWANNDSEDWSSWSTTVCLPYPGEHRIRVEAKTLGNRKNVVERIIDFGAEEPEIDFPNDCPVLMLPVRMETRYMNRNQELCVRIYPDQIFLDTHDPDLGQAEFEAGRDIWKPVIEVDPDSEDKRAAWRALAARFGQERAAWIARRMAEGANAPDKAADEGWLITPQLMALPERFHVYGYQDDKLAKHCTGRKIPPNLSVFPAPDPVTYRGEGAERVLLGRLVNLSSEPLPGLEVWVKGTHRKATTARNGSFRFVNLPDCAETADSDGDETADPDNDATVDIVVKLPAGSSEIYSHPICLKVGQGRAIIVLENDYLRSRWMTNLEQAVSDGMAVRIRFGASESRNFSKLIVAGMHASSKGCADDEQSQKSLADLAALDLAALIESHHYSGGFAFLDYGTPTNNTQACSSGYSQTTEDAKASYYTEVVGIDDRDDDRANGHRMREYLGLQGEVAGIFRNIAGAGSTADSYAEEMHTALWNATGDYLMRRLLGIRHEYLDELGQHFKRFVRGCGPLPTIRVDDQPYGILPVSSIRPSLEEGSSPPLARAHEHGWESSEPGFSRQLFFTLYQLYRLWWRWTQDPLRVPRTTDKDTEPDDTLLRIMSMEPASVAFTQHPYLGQTVAAWLRILLRWIESTDSEEEAVKNLEEWFRAWQASRREAAEFWSSMITCEQADQETITADIQLSTLSGLLSWLSQEEADAWLSQDEQIALWNLQTPLVRDKSAADQPVDYLDPDKLLNSEEEPVSDTLLCTLLRISLGLAKNDHGNGSDDTEDDGSSGYCSSIVDDMQLAIDALNDLEQGTPSHKLERDLDRLFRETLDLCTHRLDAWITSLATRRLKAMRAEKEAGIYLGAYGWVEGLKPDEDEDREPDEAAGSYGYIHAPSQAQAAAAAILHSAYRAYADSEHENFFRTNLNSERVRRSLHILEGIRQGQPVGALLGYQFERDLHERCLDQYIDDFRLAFPLVAGKETAPAPGTSVEAIAARNVVDGLALARWDWGLQEDITPPDPLAWKEVQDLKEGKDGAKLQEAIEHLQSSVDAMSDVLLYEWAYQSVQGNFDRAAAALDAASGKAFPPEIESLRTPVSGHTINHRVCLFFPEPGGEQADPVSPRQAAEPRLAAWFGDLLGDPADIACSYTAFSIDADGGKKVLAGRLQLTLKELLEAQGLSAIDLLYLAAFRPGGGQTEIEQRVAYFVRKEHELAHDSQVEIDFACPGDAGHSLADAMELARQVLRALGAGTPLRPASLYPPEQEDVVGFLGDDVVRLQARVSEALTLAREVLASVPCGETLEPLPNDETLIDFLLTASLFGIQGAIPEARDAPGLQARLRQVRNELGKRSDACDGLLRKVQDNTLEPDKKVALLIETMQALFGSNFVVLPNFKPQNEHELVCAFGHKDLLAGLGEGRLQLWLQQTALVHPALENLDGVLMMSEAWHRPALRLQAAQLPFDEDNRWLGLDKEERGREFTARDGDALSLVAAWAALDVPKVTAETMLAGLLIDQWHELVPRRILTTGISFHYDAPNAQAPQCLLLAVPPRRGKQANWGTDELAEILRDTLDLAKVRLVDLDAMRDIPGETVEESVGMVLPALFVAPESLGEEGATGSDVIDIVLKAIRSTYE